MIRPASSFDVPDYDADLKRDGGFRMSEMGRFFEQDSAVHRALRRITGKLDELGIPYALVGGMALNAHGYRRTTDDVDLLVTDDSLATIHEKLGGLGYVPPFKGSKHLRDVTEGVRIEFLTTGGYPGDGKPKPVSFPDPEHTFTVIDGLKVLKLPKVLDLKLASGLSAAHRVKDIADVQEIARSLDLNTTFSEQLDPSVRDKFIELVEALQNAPPEG